VDSLFWFLFIFLLVINFGLAAVRVGLAHTRLSGLLAIREENPKVVDRTISLLDDPRLGITQRAAGVIVHFLLVILLGWFGFTKIQNFTKIIWVSLGVVVGFGIVILSIEFGIEAIISKKSESWAIRLTPVGEMINFVFRPFAWLARVFFRNEDSLAGTFRTEIEEELKNWVEVGQPEGTLEQGERQMIYSIFHFSDTLCREIMVPRIDVFALEGNTTLGEAVQLVIESGHSRVPVYDDVIDNVVGLLYAKDLLRPVLEGKENLKIRDLLRTAYFIPEAKKVDELLREMQALGVHISVVVDEYGGMAGLVTLEDIVEEIVGEIRDEYDQREELLYQQVGKNEYLLHGRIDMDDLNEILDTHLTREVADTLGGYIYGQIGRIPAEGEQVELEDWTLTVEQVIGRRIRRVRAVRKTETEEEQKTNYAQ
jgi:putative hemolysin